jgi:hypothetical protein
MSTPAFTEMSAGDKFMLAGIRTADVITKTSDQVFRGKAPPKATYPLIVFQLIDGNDEYVVGGVRLDTELLYLVRVIQRVPTDNPDAHDEIAALIDASLTNASDEYVAHCERDRPISRSYVEGEVQYEERGAYYRLEVNPCC